MINYEAQYPKETYTIYRTTRKYLHLIKKIQSRIITLIQTLYLFANIISFDNRSIDYLPFTSVSSASQENIQANEGIDLTYILKF